MRIAIYGQYGHFNYVSEACQFDPLLRVTAVVEEEKDGLHSSFPGAKVYPDLATMLIEDKPDLLVVTPAFYKTADAIITGLLYRVPVYADKPLSLSIEKLNQIEAIWQESGVPLGAMFGITESRWFRTMRAAVDSGEIGEIRLMHGQKSYKLGNRPEFYKKRELFGGLIPWVGIHAIDWVLNFGQKVKYLSAVTSSYGNRGHGDLEVSAAVLMQFENGAIGTVTADYFRPGGSLRHDDDRLRLTGTEGMIEAINQEVYLENDGKRRKLPLLPEGNCLLTYIKSMNEGTAHKEAHRAFCATRIALMARDAADQAKEAKSIEYE